MLTRTFIKFLKNIDNKNLDKLNCILDLKRAGIKIANEYATRIDLVPLDKCYYLSEFHSPKLEKAEKHLLHFVEKHSPLISLMEYYDNYPYSYSDTNYLFKGCLKSGVEVSIKAINPVATNYYFKQLDTIKNNLKYYSFFLPWINKKYEARKMIEKLQANNVEKYNLSSEIKTTEIMQEFFDIYKDEEILNKVKLPKIYRYLSSENMIVSEFIYGSYFYELLNQNRLNYTDVLELVKVQLFCIFKIGLYHYNLHSGNLMLCENGFIHFLDCNTFATLSHQNRDILFDVILAIANRDAENTVKNLKLLSNTEIAEEEKLEKEIKNILDDFKLSVFYKILDIFKIASQYNIKYDDEIFSIFKTIIYLDILITKTKKKTHYFSTDFKEILNEINKYMIKKIKED